MVVFVLTNIMSTFEVKLGKKLTFALATHLNNSTSFFMEGASKLTSGEKVNNFSDANAEDDVVELNLYSPLYDDPILY